MLYSIKFEDIEGLLISNPDIYEKFKAIARAKREKHDKKKKKTEKKQPVYGLNGI